MAARHSQRSAGWAAVRARLNLERLLMALLLPLALLWLAGRPGLVQLDGVIYDRMLGLAPSEPASDIVIVAIDERSLRELGPWPWRRDRHALLLHRLASDAPRAVLLDLFLTEPGDDPEDDERLAEAMEKLPVYLPMRYESSAAVISGEASSFVPPLPLFSARAEGIGHANLLPDTDGIARTLYLHEGYRGRLRPYVGLLLACRSAQGPPRLPPAADVSDVMGAMEPSSPDLGESGGGWLRQQALHVPFSGPPGSYRTVSYVDVLRGKVPPDVLRDRLLLVGITAPGLGDRVPVPNAGATGTLPGIEVHANAIDSVREGRHIIAASHVSYAAWVVLSIWTALWLLGKAARHAMLLALGLAAACLALSALAMWRQHWWLPPAAPMAGVLMVYLLWSWRRLESVFAYLRQRAQALDAVAAGAFEPMPASVTPLVLDDFSLPTQALDRAIHRLTRMQALIDEALNSMPVAVLICDDESRVGSSNEAAHELLAELRAPNHRPRTSAADWCLAELIDALRNDAPPSTESPPGSGTGHWSSRLRGEHATPAGRVFRLEAAALGPGTTAGERDWVVVLPELTAEREAQRQHDEWRRFLSHDLRSPQITILSLLSMHEADSACGNLLQAVRREAERTLALAEGFLDVSEAESADYRFAETIVGAVLLDARDQVWPYAQANGVRIQMRIDAENEEIVAWADGALLTRAVVNLLNNAIRHSARGGRIDVCLAETSDASDRADSAFCIIRIGDEGEGMTDSQLHALLTAPRGRRVERHAEGKGAGFGAAPEVHRMGLGFAVVQAVVQRHGGHVEAASAPGAGSTFWLFLPSRRNVRAP